MIPDTFIEYYYGKYKTIDLHNLSKEDAKSVLFYEIGKIDSDVKAVVIVHGYHEGTVIKKLVRNEFKHPEIEEIVNLDAGRTIYLLKNRNNL